jgi:cytochrome c-type biogenesis protein CcmH
VRALAAGLLSLALLAALTSCGGANRHPTQQEMEAVLVCPICHEPLDESNSAVAEQMKAQIKVDIARGMTRDEIQKDFVATYGPAVLGVPGTHGFDLLAWLLPFVGIALGALALAGGAWYWSRSREGDTDSPGDTPGPPLDPALERRLDEELARFDA